MLTITLLYGFRPSVSSPYYFDSIQACPWDIFSISLATTVGIFKDTFTPRLINHNRSSVHVSLVNIEYTSGGQTAAREPGMFFVALLVES